MNGWLAIVFFTCISGLQAQDRAIWVSLQIMAVVHAFQATGFRFVYRKGRSIGIEGITAIKGKSCQIPDP
jgi:hypothetical protein